VALGFATSKGVVMEISLFDAVSIIEYSPFKAENEVLLSPNMGFFVSQEVQYDIKREVNILKLVQKRKKSKLIF